MPIIECINNLLNLGFPDYESNGRSDLDDIFIQLRLLGTLLSTIGFLMMMACVIILAIEGILILTMAFGISLLISIAITVIIQAVLSVSGDEMSKSISDVMENVIGPAIDGIAGVALIFALIVTFIDMMDGPSVAYHHINVGPYDQKGKSTRSFTERLPVKSGSPIAFCLAILSLILLTSKLFFSYLGDAQHPLLPLIFDIAALIAGAIALRDAINAPYSTSLSTSRALSGIALFLGFAALSIDLVFI